MAVGRVNESGAGVLALSEATSQIVRAPGLPIIVGDFASVAFLGRDYEVCLYASAARVNAFAEFREGAIGPGQVDAEQVYTETARVRLSPPAAIHVIGNLLFNMKLADPDGYDDLISPLRELMPASPERMSE